MIRFLRRTILGLTIAFGLLVPLTAHAQQEVLRDACDDVPDSTLCTQSRNTPTGTRDNALYGPDGLITKVARLLSLVAGVASVIMIMIGGIRYVLSSGDSTNVQGAKNTILFAVIGALVAGSAQLIVSFVLVRL